MAATPRIIVVGGGLAGTTNPTQPEQVQQR